MDTTIINLVKDFYSKWIPDFINPSGYSGEPSERAKRLLTEGYLTPNAVDLINKAQAYDVVTCSQNPLMPEEYSYSGPVINGDKASMTVSGNYTGDTLNITVDLIKPGTKWKIDGFRCPPPKN